MPATCGLAREKIFLFELSLDVPRTSYTRALHATRDLTHAGPLYPTVHTGPWQRAVAHHGITAPTLNSHRPAVTSSDTYPPVLKTAGSWVALAFRDGTVAARTSSAGWSQTTCKPRLGQPAQTGVR